MYTKSMQGTNYDGLVQEKVSPQLMHWRYSRLVPSQKQGTFKITVLFSSDKYIYISSKQLSLQRLKKISYHHWLYIHEVPRCDRPDK